MSALLIISTGRTDVQLVKGNTRCEFPSKSCGQFHQELEERRKDWTIVRTPVGGKGLPVVKLPEEPFEIGTPKLDAVLDYLQEHDIQVQSALVLHTRRNPLRFIEEPSFVGQIVYERLSNTLNDVRLVHYLSGDETMETDADLIRPEAVDRIHKSIAQAFDIRPNQVVIASTGGIPEIRKLLGDVVRLHARDGTVVDLDVSDGTKKTPPADDKAIKRSETRDPSESFRARRIALKLIEKGDFLGAWGAASHFNGVPPNQKWTSVIGWLKDFASSLPIDRGCDIEVLHGPLIAVQMAIRVELALMLKDFPRAVHGTYAFLECALWDHLDHHLKEGRGRAYGVKPNGKGIPSDLLRINGAPADRPFEQVREGYRVYDNLESAITLASPAYLDKPSLKQFCQAAWDIKLGRLRNDVVHRAPTPSKMRNCQEDLKRGHLWSSRSRFLSQPLVQNVLTELSVNNPERLCEDLIAEVRKRLREP